MTFNLERCRALIISVLEGIRNEINHDTGEHTTVALTEMMYLKEGFGFSLKIANKFADERDAFISLNDAVCHTLNYIFNGDIDVSSFVEGGEAEYQVVSKY